MHDGRTSTERSGTRVRQRPWWTLRPPGRFAVGVVGLLALLGGVQYALSLSAASSAGSTSGAPSGAAAAVVAAYEENLLDPAPAVRRVLDAIAARPGVVEVALVNGEGTVETVGGDVPGATFVPGQVPPADARAEVGAALSSGARAGGDGGVLAEPVAIHDDTHALVIRQAPAAQVVSLADLRWILPATLVGAAGLFLAAAGVSRRLRGAVPHRAGFDALTGLMGHGLFRAELERQVDVALRRAQRISLALFDVDGLADLNRARGYRHGDAALVDIAVILRSGREEDAPFRIDGDGFAVLYPHTAAADAWVAVDRVRQAVAAAHPGLTVSAGIADLDHSIPSADAVLARAELALHDAKGAGGDRVALYGLDIRSLSG